MLTAIYFDILNSNAQILSMIVAGPHILHGSLRYFNGKSVRLTNSSVISIHYSFTITVGSVLVTKRQFDFLKKKKFNCTRTNKPTLSKIRSFCRSRKSRNYTEAGKKADDYIGKFLKDDHHTRMKLHWKPTFRPSRPSSRLYTGYIYLKCSTSTLSLELGRFSLA